MVTNLILDTHALVEFVNTEIPSVKLEGQLERYRKAGRLFVSAVSFWEI